MSQPHPHPYPSLGVRHPSVPIPIRRLAPIALALLASCGKSIFDPGGKACTDIAVAGINLTVADSITGGPVASTEFWSRAVDGAYRDSTTRAFPNPPTGAIMMALVYERAGTYAVTVHANGYQDWNKSGIVVTKGVCHVIGVQVIARLVK